MIKAHLSGQAEQAKNKKQLLLNNSAWFMAEVYSHERKDSQENNPKSRSPDSRLLINCNQSRTNTIFYSSLEMLLRCISFHIFYLFWSTYLIFLNKLHPALAWWKTTLLPWMQQDSMSWNRLCVCVCAQGVGCQRSTTADLRYRYRIWQTV